MATEHMHVDWDVSCNIAMLGLPSPEYDLAHGPKIGDIHAP
jgi:hypothetical protein